MQINCPVDDGCYYTIVVDASGARTLAANGTDLGYGKIRKVPLDKVYLKIFAGKHSTLPIGSPPTSTNPNGFHPATIDGQWWCSNDVPVPAAAAHPAPGDEDYYTLFAYGIDNTGTTTAPAINQFRARVAGSGSGTLVACAGCVSGGGTGPCPPAVVLANALARAAKLDVTVPDGPGAGVASARLTGPLRWAVTVGGAAYEIFVCPTRGLVLRDAATEVVGAVRHHPFSATFPGALLKARGDVVVTVG